MGNLMLNDISYSNNGTGVLMLNGVNYTGGSGGGGGGVNTTIGTFFNFTPNANTTPTGIMLFKNGNTMYCVYTCNDDEFYYDTANSKIVRTGFYYADTMPSAIPANYRNFLFQNGGDITGVAQANLGNYFIHSTYDIKDQNGNVLVPKDVNIEDFGL